MEQTEKYKKLPPEAGVPFTGFTYAEIESRKPVAQEIQTFVEYCVKDARSPAARIILGEWGEGKSEAYYRYIAPAVEKRGYAYDVSAPTISEIYKTPSKNEKIKTTSSTAVQFLASVFWAIREELKARETVSEAIPPIEKFADLIEWLKTILKNHARAPAVKIFIFIDQTEELVLEPTVLKWFLTGIRETIDGKFLPISEKGIHPGSVFFFLSCTPDAYNRMRIDPDIDQIFGGQQRRIERITLYPTGKKEGIDFFYNLLRFSYDDSLPKKLPFKSSGILHSLYTVTRGNLGSMVSLFARLMSSISANGKLNVIDGEFLMEWLSNEEVSIYGGIVHGVEKEIVNQVESELQKSRIAKDCIRLFKLLTGELKPFSVEDLKKRFQFSASELFQLINATNQYLKELMGEPIIRFYPMKEGLSFTDFVEKMRAMGYIGVDENREQVLLIDNYSEKLNVFQDRITFADIDENNNLIYRIYFPMDIEVFPTFFEGIFQENALKLRKIVSGIVDDRDKYFMLSEEAANKLFPIPVSPWLQFLKNRDLRLKLWRNVTANFHKLFYEHMVRAFIDLIRGAERLEIKDETRHLSENSCCLKIHEKSRDIDIASYVYSRPGYVEERDLEKILPEIKSVTPRPHLIILLYTDELTESAREKARELEERLLPLRLHPTHAKNMIAIHLSIEHYSQLIDPKELENVIGNLVREVGIEKEVQSWLDKGRENGLVLTNLIRYTAKSDKDLADALKFYINFLGMEKTPEEIFELNSTKLVRLVPFGLRLGFAPDIETKEQFRKLTEDLKVNKFVQDITGKIQVASHPVEKRIIELLKERKEINLDMLRQVFITSATARNILEDVYVSILEDKGLVDVKGELITLKAVDEYQKYVKNRYEEYKAKSKILLPVWKDYAHVFVIKQRGPRLILIKDFDNFLSHVYEEIVGAHDKNICVQRLRLLDQLISHFEQHLKPKIELAVKRSRGTKDNTETKFKAYEQTLANLLQGYNEFTEADYALDDVKEYTTIKNQMTELMELYSRELTETELMEVAKGLDDNLFEHTKYKQLDQLFNIKLTKLENLLSSLTSEIDQKQIIIQRISASLGNIKAKVDSIDSKIISLKIETDYKISSAVHQALQQFYAPPKKFFIKLEESTKGSKKIKLPEIEKDLGDLQNIFIQKEASLIACVVALEDLYEVEKEFQRLLSETNQKINKFRINMDLKEYLLKVKELDSMLSDATTAYDDIKVDFSSVKLERRSIDKITKILDKQVSKLHDLSTGMEDLWGRYKENTARQITTIQEIFKILEKLGYTVDVKKRDKLTTDSTTLLKWIDGITPWRDEVKLSELEESKEKLRKEMSEVLAHFLTSEESVVLRYVIEEGKKFEGKWVPVEHLKLLIEKEKKDVDVVNVVRKLIDRGIIKPAVTFVS